MQDNRYNAEAFSKNVKTLLWQRNITARKLCSDIGITYATFSKWMGAVTMPNVPAVLKMAEYFDVYPDALFGAEPSSYCKRMEQLQRDYETLQQENQKLRIENELLKDCIKRND